MDKRIFIFLILVIFLVGCQKKVTIVGEEIVYVNESITLSINEYDNITWESSNPSVATVEDGIVRGISAGEAIIFAYHKNNLLDTHQVIVIEKAILHVIVDDFIAISDIKNIQVTSDYLDDVFHYESSDSSIATIDDQGKITGVSVGTTTIIITSLHHGYYEFVLNVIEFYNPIEVRIINTLDEYIIGIPYKLEAIVLPSNSPQEIEWEVLGKKATINNETSEITFVDSGDVYVICRSAYDKSIMTTVKLISKYDDNEDIINILFIGNSHTYFNDVPGMVEELCRASGISINCEAVTEGGATIASLIYNYSNEIINFLENDDYEYIIVQEQSTANFLYKNSFLNAVLALQDLVRNFDVEIFLYQTWAYREGSNLLKDLNLTREEMHQKIYDAYHYVSSNTGLNINPVGDVFNQFLIDHPEINIYNDDNHANRAGSFLSACVHYVSIFNKPITNVEFDIYLSKEIKEVIANYVSNYLLN